MSQESRSDKVSLGCGTLILIALIVLIFGRCSTDDLEREVRSLRTAVTELKASVDGQSAEIGALREQVTPRPAAEAGR